MRLLPHHALRPPLARHGLSPRASFDPHSFAVLDPNKLGAALAPYIARGGTSDSILLFFAKYVFEPAVRLTLIAAGVMLCVGSLLTVTNTLLFFINKSFGTSFGTFMDFWPRRRRQPVQLTRVKLQLGYTAGVALQLLVVADVLDTLLKPSHAFSIEELVKLAMIAGIRTVLAVFLAAEVTEAEHELENQGPPNVTV